MYNLSIVKYADIKPNIKYVSQQKYTHIQVNSIIFSRYTLSSLTHCIVRGMLNVRFGIFMDTLNFITQQLR